MQSVNFGDGNANCGNIAGSFNIYKSDEDAQIMRWLSPLEPNKRHQGVRNDRLDGVGDWFLETSEFRNWRGGEGGADEAVLFCSGNPGVGKTYLSSLVIDRLCDQAKKKDIAVACFYCDYKAQQEQTITNMVGAILKQLVGRRGIPDYVREAFQEGKMEIGGRGLRLAGLMGMLRVAIASIPQVFICIDALDEYLPKHLPELLGSLRDIVRESPKVRIFLTGRLHVKEEIQRYFVHAVVTPVSTNEDDIRSYVEWRLERDAEHEAMNDELRVDIVRTIVEKISDIFLLVSLNMDAILGEVTIRQRRKKLEAIAKGNGLGDAYTATLARLKAQKGYKSVLGLKVLMWVLYSQRPLRAEELRHALGVEEGSTDLDVENAPALRMLVASSVGLVMVEASSSTVRLVHFTLQEYLSSDPTLFPSPHSEIAEVCLTYLNFRSVCNLSPTLRSAPPTMPLLEYAACYWGEHSARSMTDNVKRRALRLLDGFDKHIAAKLMLLQSNRYRHCSPHFSGQGGPIGFTGLHGAAFLGIVELAAAVLAAKEWDFDATDGLGLTAFIWAAIRGHEKLVKLLLEREAVNPNKPDAADGRTPLSWAAEYGREGVVKILLQRGDVNPHMVGTGGCTPLLWAAVYGHEGVVKMLLERKDVNPDQAETRYGRSPLSWAAENRHEGVVKMLLERKDVNPDKADTKYGRSPLSWAAENGHEGVVEILLERKDVNPDQADTKYGQTPLSWAAENGHEGVVKILLQQKDVNPDQADIEHGRSPLLFAAEKGHQGVVKMLLQREEVNPNKIDTKYGQSPLSWAAENGHETVVKMLLEQKDVNPDQTDIEDRRSPLSFAAGKGHEGVVKILLEREDVNPDMVDTKGYTPLSWAAMNGKVGVVKMLLQRADVNPNQADTEYGQSPISWAAENGHEGVVKTLLERKDVNPDQAGTEDGRSPLSWAAENGNEGVVKMLLERKDVNPDQADTEYGQTPLSWAAESGYDGVVKMLLQREDVNPNTIDLKHGSTPLSWAAFFGNEGVVKELLERKDVNPDQADTLDGRTPLSCAAESGHEGIVRMLLQRPDVNPNTVETKYGRTALSQAAKWGHEGVVKILLERKDVLATIPDNEGQTPLSLAISAGHHGIAKILREWDNFGPDTSNSAAQASAPPPTERGDRHMVMMQSAVEAPNSDIVDLHSQPALPSADPDEPEALSNLNASVSESAHRGVSSGESFTPPQPLSISHPNPPHSPTGENAHPNEFRLILAVLFSPQFIIVFLVCLPVLLVCILPSSFLDTFSFPK